MGFHVLNGWGTISESDSNKALGFHISRSITDDTDIGYGNFYGKVAGKRFFHDFWVDHVLANNLELRLLFDYGQDKNNGTSSNFFTINLQTRYSFDGNKSATFRYEYYKDDDQVNIDTAAGQNTLIHGFSLNFDNQIEEFALFRIEYRILTSPDRVPFIKEKDFAGSTHFLTTSLAMNF